MDRPFLQTPEWLRFQEALGRKVWRIHDGFISASIVRHDVRMGQNFLYVPYGPELNLDQADGGLRNQVWKFVRDITALARHEGSMFVKLEPTHDVAVEVLIRNGMRLKKSPHHLQPQRTVVADLTQTEEQLTAKLHHKHRYNIGLAERKGVTIGESHDVDAFWKLLQATAEHDDFRSHPRLYYQKLLNEFRNQSGAIRTKLFFAYHGGRPIAGTLMLEHGRTVYYLHGASDRQERALMAPHLLHWKLMAQYKAKGFTDYDFWGINAQAWPGVTRFKLGFGARVVEYPGAFDVVLKPLWRWLYHVVPR
jgi:peptidoglycan pentaglycine glycine transferase (the first glycine)